MDRYGSESTSAGRQLAQLRRAVAQIEVSGPSGRAMRQPGQSAGAVPLGVDGLDCALGGSGHRGLALGCVHDIHPAAPGDAGAAAGFALGCLARVLAARPGPAFVIQDAAGAREHGQLYAPGLLAFGIDPGRLVCVCLHKVRDVLAAVEETLACHVPVAVLAETSGPHGSDALTASRRLVLRAGHGDHLVLALRHAPAEASAARTRFHVAAVALQHHERGPPAFALSPPVIDVALARNRAGACGRWRLGWNPQALEFAQAPDAHTHDTGIPDTRIRNTPSDTEGHAANERLPGPAAAQRILCLWLPRLATDRLHSNRLHRDSRTANAGRGPADTPACAGPLATVETVGNAMRLGCVDAAGLAAGLAPGMALADARAMCPGLEAVAADPAADARLLRRLAAWCDRFTPLVAIDSTSGLLLDITGCAHLFGGEAGLAGDLARRLSAQGLNACIAVAGWPAAARALVHAQHDARPRIVVHDEELTALRSLPLAVTDIPADTLTGLRRLGLRTIADVLDRPLAPLSARFGQGLADAVRRLSGIRAEPVSPLRPPAAFMAERAFAEPVLLLDGLLDCVYRLLGHLAQSLERAGHGVRVLRLAFYRVDGSLAQRTLATSRPNRDAAELCDLFARLIERDGEAIDAGFGVDLVRVAAVVTGPLDPRQQQVAGIADPGHETGEDVARLVDRLGARFGRARISRLAPVDSHVPEHAALRCAPHASPDWSRETPARDPATPGLLLRPLRLYDRPEPVEVLAEVPDGPPVRFRWRRVLHEVVACEGPERIGAQWWTAPDDDPDAATRDYYRLQDAAGRRYWVFRQGLYARSTPLVELAGSATVNVSQVPDPADPPASPRWFLHGIFA